MTTYGEEVYNLAETFVDDARNVDKEMRKQAAHELAMEIQDTIDNWFYGREN